MCIKDKTMPPLELTWCAEGTYFGGAIYKLNFFDEAMQF